MTILGLIILVLVFCLLAWAIYLLPLPPTSPGFIKPVLTILLIVVAVIVLLSLGGMLGSGLNTRVT